MAVHSARPASRTKCLLTRAWCRQIRADRDQMASLLRGLVIGGGLPKTPPLNGCRGWRDSPAVTVEGTHSPQTVTGSDRLHGSARATSASTAGESLPFRGSGIINCQFYGDFLLDNPTSFEDALKTYQNLSKILRENKNNSVPVEVFLTPLKKYDSNAPAGTSNTWEQSRGRQDNTETHKTPKFKINTQKTQILTNNVLKFSYLCKKYENHDNLDKWMSDKEAEVTALKICLGAMEGIKIISNELQLKEVFSQDVVHTLCFTFTSLEQALDPYLDQLENSLHSHDMPGFKQVSAPKQNQWYHSNSLIHELRSKAQDLQNMAKGLKANVKFHFLVAAMQNPKIQGASIYHCKQGRLVSENFSKPEVPEVKTIRNKEDLILYACDLTLDPNTANYYLIFSEENKRAECTSTWQYCPDHPDKFNKPQVLCKEAVTGRWSGVRKGLCLGEEDKSWYFGQNSGFEAWRNGKLWSGGALAGGCRIIGVYLDLKGGPLSFYKVSCDKLEHLYTFKTTFIDHVYPGFYIYSANNYCRLSPKLLHNKNLR
uniref:SPRY-associated domain-containing protein n=1 Tax=Xiphophorus maculatus TaxID=8083 RepID=A0A3B5QV79_XIPMA